MLLTFQNQAQRSSDWFFLFFFFFTPKSDVDSLKIAHDSSLFFTVVEVAPKSSSATVADQANEVSISTNFVICIHLVFHSNFGFDVLKC